jgi:hypothetical protein
MPLYIDLGHIRPVERTMCTHADKADFGQIDVSIPSEGLAYRTRLRVRKGEISVGRLIVGKTRLAAEESLIGTIQTPQAIL